MKPFYLLFATLLLCIAPKAKAQNAQSIIGTWLSESKDGKILIYQSGNKFFGKLIGSSKNLIILSDFIYSDGKWKEGHVYDPKNGKLYNAVLTLKSNQLEIRGYVGISLFGRSTVWTRSE